MSRHHILPPIVYTPAPPKPKKTERRARTSALKKSEAAASEDVGDTQQAGEVFTSGATAPAQVHPQDPFAPVESAEHRIPSTTGKLSDGTLKELLLAQEQEQEPQSAAVAPLPSRGGVETSEARSLGRRE
jgi:hypothetical protein